MARTRSVANRLVIIGLATIVIGGVMVGSAMAASAAGPSITAAPNTGLSPSDPVAMSGTGFMKGTPSPGGYAECSTAADQPTVSVAGYPNPLPVSCSNPNINTAKRNKAGKVPFSGIAAQTGFLGPPATGTDSGPGSTGNAGADAANFPCPPFQSQVNAGASCEVLYVDAAGESASTNITFLVNSTPDTTVPASTTTAPCNAVNKTVTAVPGTPAANKGSATVTVAPDTCLVGGEKVTVTATGLIPDPFGTVLECNSDTGQPTVSLSGTPLPVSCTPVLAYEFTPPTSSSGTITATNNATKDPHFVVVVNTTGPPTTGTDTAGNDAAADAVKYPCPPTPTQVAAGDTCVIAVADLGGDEVVVPIAFNTNAALTNSGGSGGVTTTVKAATSAATKTGSSSLAFTGTGPGLWWLGLFGVVLIILGGLVLLVVDGPRRMLRFARTRAANH